jgi:hypothetical protein
MSQAPCVLISPLRPIEPTSRAHPQPETFIERFGSILRDPLCVAAFGGYFV